MPELVGLCSICGKPAVQTCSLCGRPACGSHLKNGVCTSCSSGRRMKP